MTNFFCWFGMVTFSIAVLLGGWFLLLTIGESVWFGAVKRRAAHGLMIFRLVFLGATPWRMSPRGARIVFEMASRRRKFQRYDWWERRLAAYLVIYNRRVGFTK